MSQRYPDTDVLVFGHSHIPWDTTSATGLRLLNPGSPTDRRRQPYCTYMTATADDGRLGNVTLHRLAGSPCARPIPIRYAMRVFSLISKSGPDGPWRCLPAESL